MKPIPIEEILDRTQGHLILRWNAWKGSEQLRRIGLPTLYSYIALFLLIAFAVESFVHHRNEYGIALLVFAGLTIFANIYLRISGNRHAANTFIVILYGLLCLFLLFTGGAAGTGPIWYCVFPLLALFVQRLWAGTLSVLTLFIVTIILLWHPIGGFDPSVYSQEFKERFLAVYLTVSVMTFLYAFLRTSTEMLMDNLNKDLKDMADTDELTRLANRRRMKEVLYREVSRVRRTHGTFSLIILDLDNFKTLNDDYGHDCGDAVLRNAPGTIHSVLRSQDVCARWGGEEFLIMLPATELKGSVLVAERLRTAFEKSRVKFGDLELTVTASLGLSEFKFDSELDKCLQTADRNLYIAKATGRNRVVAK